MLGGKLSEQTIKMLSIQNELMTKGKILKPKRVYVSSGIDTMRIRIFADNQKGQVKTRTIAELETLYETAVMSIYGKKRQLYLTDGNDYTHVLLINYAMPTIRHIPHKNVIGISHLHTLVFPPPRKFVIYAQQYIHTYFVGDIGTLPSPFVTYQVYPFYQPPRIGQYTKTKLMSISLSIEVDSPGQIYLHSLAKYILTTSIPVDIYGHGCILFVDQYGDKDESDIRIKGPCSETDPSAMLDDYMFHINAENFCSKSRYTCRLIDALIRKTIPIYNGCESVFNDGDEYASMILRLSGVIEIDMEIIGNIAKNPLTYYRYIDHNMVRKRENLIHNLPRLFEYN